MVSNCHFFSCTSIGIVNHFACSILGLDGLFDRFQFGLDFYAVARKHADTKLILKFLLVLLVIFERELIFFIILHFGSQALLT